VKETKQVMEWLTRLPEALRVETPAAPIPKVENPTGANAELNQKIRDLIPQFIDSDSRNRGAAHNELEKIGRPALPQLRESLNKAEQQGDQTTINQLRTLIQKIEKSPEPASPYQSTDPDAKLREQTIGTWDVFKKDGSKASTWQFFADGKGKTLGGIVFDWKIENGQVRAGANLYKVTDAGKEMNDGNLTFKKR
jgi:hypothetical protein